MKNKILTLTALVVLGVSAVLRLARPELVGFYYDQGRDALVVWDLWHKGKLFLIGPTTGIEGIFLGPAYYYLIATIYKLANGDPMWVVRFLGILNIVGLVFLYKLGKQYFSAPVGLLAVLFAGLSYYNVMDQRWLSNPNPLTLVSIIIFWLLSKLIRGERNWFPAICLLIGVGLQFEAASAVFFLPSLLIILWLFRKSINLDFKNLCFGAGLFGLTLVPQVWFNFRHENLLLNAFNRFLFAEKSFSQSPLAIIPSRLAFYFETFTNRFSLSSAPFRWLAITLVLVGLLKGLPYLWKNAIFRLGLIWILVPIGGLLFYTGNHGYVWGYYFTGIYPVIYLLVAACLAELLRYRVFGAAIVLLFTIITIGSGWAAFKHHYTTDVLKTDRITLGGSLAVVDWVYQDAGSLPFNVDVYVPPVIPYAYDYLFKWRGDAKYGVSPKVESVGLLYTPYEPDGDHPERLQKWLDRQSGVGSLNKEEKLGALTVQRRSRINYEK